MLSWTPSSPELPRPSENTQQAPVLHCRTQCSPFQIAAILHARRQEVGIRRSCCSRTLQKALVLMTVRVIAYPLDHKRRHSVHDPCSFHFKAKHIPFHAPLVAEFRVFHDLVARCDEPIMYLRVMIWSVWPFGDVNRSAKIAGRVM